MFTSLKINLILEHSSYLLRLYPIEWVAKLKDTVTVKLLIYMTKLLSKRIVSISQLLREPLISLWLSKPWKIVLKYLLATENLLKK